MQATTLVRLQPPSWLVCDPTELNDVASGAGLSLSADEVEEEEDVVRLSFELVFV